jgi:hypothetical protein
MNCSQTAFHLTIKRYLFDYMMDIFLFREISTLPFRVLALFEVFIVLLKSFEQDLKGKLYF